MSDDPLRFVVTVNGQVVARASDIQTLAAEAGGGSSWNVVSAGEQIDLSPMPGATSVMALFVPDEATILELDGNVGFGEVVDVGVRVNGHCWGWAQGTTPNSWLLLPCDFETGAAERFDFSASQEASMTGMTIRVTCRAMNGVAVARQSDDVEGLGWLRVAYGDDLEPLVERAARVAFNWETIDSFCPVCVEEQGWLLSVDYDRTSSEQPVMRALDECWRPCEGHVASAREGVDLIGVSIRWMDDHWEPAG